MINKNAFVVLRLGQTIGYKTPSSNGSVKITTVNQLERWLNWLLSEYKFTTMAINKYPTVSGQRHDECQRQFIERFCERRNINLLRYDPETVKKTLMSMGIRKSNMGTRVKDRYGITPKTKFASLPCMAYLHYVKTNGLEVPEPERPLTPEEVLEKYRNSTHGLVKELL